MHDDKTKMLLSGLVAANQTTDMKKEKRSKYVPHQGKREIERRARKLAAA